jgi:hypothetical protein
MARKCPAGCKTVVATILKSGGQRRMLRKTA